MSVRTNVWSALLAVWVGTIGADLASTHLAMQHGAQEVVLPAAAGPRDALLVGEAVSGAWAVGKLWHTGHKKAALGVVVAGAAVHGLATAHNLAIR